MGDAETSCLAQGNFSKCTKQQNQSGKPRKVRSGATFLQLVKLLLAIHSLQLPDHR